MTREPIYAVFADLSFTPLGLEHTWRPDAAPFRFVPNPLHILASAWQL